MADDSMLSAGVTRRDFMNTTLLGAGAALLHAGCPAFAQDLGPEWDGPGGVGDYRRSNGNTAAVTQAAHQIRDQSYVGDLANVTDTREQYDLIVVGGGFGGLAALVDFRRLRPNGTALLIDNQEVFGGYAKANEFDVDGHRIAGPQASMNFILPATDEERAKNYWDDLGLPTAFRYAEAAGGNREIVFQKSASGALYHGEQSATVGYRFGDNWVTDIWRDDLTRSGFSEVTRASLLTLREMKRRGKPTGAEAKRLDAITFEQYATQELKLSPDVLSYVSMGMCQTGPQVSALAAMSLPGIDRYAPGSPQAAVGERFISFPGGNTGLARYFVKALIPDAIGGPNTPVAIAATGPIDFAALDRAGAPIRLRQRATVARVEHRGRPDASDGVDVTYEKGGKLYRARARAAVMTSGAWVTKHIVAGLPDDQKAAFDAHLFAPMLIINVALRNWRFLDKLGFSAARWFDGFGFYASIRKPMILGDQLAAFGPDKPIVMTFYVPFQNPDQPLEAQGSVGRAELYGTAYADYEKRIVDQMTTVFAAGGFDAKRDIAGIVLNRWGHAFLTAGPGFFHGTNGGPAPWDAAVRPFGRIGFGRSEDWLGTAHASRRALGELAAVL